GPTGSGGGGRQGRGGAVTGPVAVAARPRRVGDPRGRSQRPPQRAVLERTDEHRMTTGGVPRRGLVGWGPGRARPRPGGRGGGERGEGGEGGTGCAGIRAGGGRGGRILPAGGGALSGGLRRRRPRPGPVLRRGRRPGQEDHRGGGRPRVRLPGRRGGWPVR